MKYPDYEINDTVTYNVGREERRVLVTLKSDDIKNGRPGFDGIDLDTQMPVWGYDHQIVRVETRES